MAKILTVDDNPVDRLALKSILESHEHQVFEADDGATAMQLLGDEKVDIVLLDINMPDMDGVEMLNLLRRAWKKEELPVILVTGLDDRKALSEMLARGANDYILKPISPVTVQARLAIHLELVELRRKSSEA